MDDIERYWFYTSLGCLSVYFIEFDFSTQAAYAAPIIMMSQNRQNKRDRIQAEQDYKTNIDAKKEIGALQIQLNKLEAEKLDRILDVLIEILQKQK